MKNSVSVLAILLSAVVVSGCSVTRDIMPQQSIPEDLYLRGVFNWWEAEQDYKLKSDEDAVYFATAELIADGQPYDFRFADADWTPGANCGYASEKDQVLKLGQNSYADCESENNHFQFTPKETDTYKFSIDFSDPERPEVTVTKA